VFFFPNDTISLPLPTVDKKVWELKSFFAVVILLDTDDLPNGSATSVNYGGRDKFNLVCNAHNSLLALGRILPTRQAPDGANRPTRTHPAHELTAIHASKAVEQGYSSFLYTDGGDNGLLFLFTNLLY
jgi:hypothetical protein